MSIKSNRHIYSLSNFEIAQASETQNNELRGKKYWGYSCVDGKLAQGMGIEPATVTLYPMANSPEAPLTYEYTSPDVKRFEVLGYFRGYVYTDKPVIYPSIHCILFWGDDGCIHYSICHITCDFLSVNFEDVWDYSRAPEAINFCRNNIDTVIFAAEKEKMYVWNPTSVVPPLQINLPDTITSMCENDGLMYATTGKEKKRIMYTTNQNIEDFGSEANDGGTIRLSDDRGPSIKVISFKGSVYVFRELGITKLARLANGTHNITQMYQSPSRIYGNTVAVCGDKIIFLSKSGFFSFNGVNVSKISTAAEEIVLKADNEYARADCLNDKYYLSGSANFDDGRIVGVEENSTHINNVLLALNISDYTYEVIRGVDLSRILGVKDISMEKLICTQNLDHQRDIAQLCKNGKYFDTYTEKYFETYEIKFEDKNCRIARVEVDCRAGTIIDIITDATSLHFVAVKDGYNFYTPYVKAQSAKVILRASDTDGTYVNEVKITTSGSKE